MLPLLPDYATVNLMAAYSFKLADAKMTAQVNIYGAPFTVMNSLRAEF
jgi:hypothetical protein